MRHSSKVIGIRDDSARVKSLHGWVFWAMLLPKPNSKFTMAPIRHLLTGGFLNILAVANFFLLVEFCSLIPGAASLIASVVVFPAYALLNSLWVHQAKKVRWLPWSGIYLFASLGVASTSQIVVPLLRLPYVLTQAIVVGIWSAFVFIVGRFIARQELGD